MSSACRITAVVLNQDYGPSAAAAAAPVNLSTLTFQLPASGNVAHALGFALQVKHAYEEIAVEVPVFIIFLIYWSRPP